MNCFLGMFDEVLGENGELWEVSFLNKISHARLLSDLRGRFCENSVSLCTHCNRSENVNLYTIYRQISSIFKPSFLRGCFLHLFAIVFKVEFF